MLQRSISLHLTWRIHGMQSSFLSISTFKSPKTSSSTCQIPPKINSNFPVNTRTAYPKHLALENKQTTACRLIEQRWPQWRCWPPPPLLWVLFVMSQPKKLASLLTPVPPLKQTCFLPADTSYGLWPTLNRTTAAPSSIQHQPALPQVQSDALPHCQELSPNRPHLCKGIIRRSR